MAEINGTLAAGRTLKRAAQYEVRARESPCLLLRQCVRDNQKVNIRRQERINILEYSAHFLEDATRRDHNVAAELECRYLEQFRQQQEIVLRGQDIIRPGHLANYLGRGRSI